MSNLIVFVYNPNVDPNGIRGVGAFVIHKTWEHVPRKGETVALTLKVDNSDATKEFDFSVDRVHYRGDLGDAFLYLTLLLGVHPT